MNHWTTGEAKQLEKQWQIRRKERLTVSFCLWGIETLASNSWSQPDYYWRDLKYSPCSEVSRFMLDSTCCTAYLFLKDSDWQHHNLSSSNEQQLTFECVPLLWNWAVSASDCSFRRGLMCSRTSWGCRLLGTGFGMIRRGRSEWGLVRPAD